MRYIREGEELTGIVPAEPATGVRVYLCVYVLDGERSWLVLDGDGAPVESRALVRQTVSIAALCELAEEAAGVDGETGARLATPERLDQLGADAPRVADVLKGATASVSAMTDDVEQNYKRALS